MDTISDKDYREQLSKALENYINKYYDKVTEDNAQQVILDFNNEWEKQTAFICDYAHLWYTNKEQELTPFLSKYGLSLAILSAAYYHSSMIKDNDLISLQSLILEYESNNQLYKIDTLRTLYLHLGLCWHKLGVIYDNNAINAFKKYIYYYYITLTGNHKNYLLTAYSFRECNKHLYQTLINEELSLSSPITFNDPFDCPIIELLNNKDTIPPLMRKAYMDCLKIRCFTSNVKMPFPKDSNDLQNIVKNAEKHNEDNDEFLNGLMWAHYADYHKGICIKYTFSPEIIEQIRNQNGVVAFFKDVKYSNEDMEQYSQKDIIGLEDAFFLKGKEWEYENELRFLYYDVKGNGEHCAIDIPNCIEAIYFGLKCSMYDRDALINLMKNKKVVIKDIYGNTKVNPVKFYQMVINEKHFGQLKAIEIK